MRLLIVEDDSVVAQMYGQCLERDGFCTRIASSLQGAREAISQWQPDIMLLDRMLPDGDGGPFCRSIKNDPCTESIYVILISGVKTSETEQVYGLDIGADDYLFKPMGIDVLLARVRVAARSRKNQMDLRALIQSLSESEERFRGTFEQAAMGMTHVAPDGRFLRVNQLFCQIVGYDEDELLALHTRQIILPDDLAESARLTAQLLDGSIAAFTVERRYVHKDGTLVWTNVSVSLLSGPNQTLLIEAVRDIGERKATEAQLRRSEEAFRNLVENTPDAIVVYDRDLRYTYVSPRSVELMDVDPRRVIGKTNQELSVREDLCNLWDSAIREVFAQNHQSQVEFVMTVRGEARYFQSYLVPELDSSGAVTSVLSVTRDVTRRVNAEMDNLRLATVVEQAAEGILISSLDHEIIYANPNLRQMTGYSWEELEGQNPAIFRTSTHPQEFYDDISRVLHAGKPWRGTVVNKRKDGSLLHVDASSFPIFNSAGEIINYATVRRDVTAQVQMQHTQEAIIAIAAALRQADTKAEIVEITTDQVHLLLQTESTAIALVENDGVGAVVAVSKGNFAPVGTYLDPHNSVTGYVMATGQVYVNNNPETDPRLCPSNQNKELHAMAAVPLVVLQRTIGVLWAGRAEPIDENDMQILAAIGDIAANAIYRAELYAQSLEHAAQLEQRVAERTRQLQDANAELQVLDKLKSKFIYDISHELRTPLGSLKLYLDLMTMGRPEKQEQYKKAVYQMIERLTQLVESILDITILESERGTPPMLQPVDLNGLIAQTVDIFLPRAESAGLAFRFEPEASLPHLLGDGGQLSRLISSLLANAIAYTPSGHVTVSTSIAGDTGDLLLVVADSGVGIGENELPYIFDRFYRGIQGESGIPGTGLGLTIAREIVNMHGGHIHIQSQVGQGTTVTVSFPQARAACAQ